MKRSLGFISDDEKLRTSIYSNFDRLRGWGVLLRFPYFNVLYSTLLYLPPLRCHCAGERMLGSNPGLLRLLALAVRRSVTSRLVFIYFSSKFWYFHRYWEYFINSQWILKFPKIKLNLKVTFVSPWYVFIALHSSDLWDSPEMCISHWALCAQMHRVSEDSCSRPGPRPPKNSFKIKTF